MKLFISADIEGVCGVTSWDEVRLDNPQHKAKQMTREVAAACQAALDFGYTEIVVKDAHATGRNLIIDELPRGVKVLRGWSGGYLSMMEGLDGSFAGACYVGYHSAAGKDGNPLAHTYNSQTVYSYTLNDQPASEFLLNHYLAANLGVPSLFLSGDQQICSDAKRIAPGLKSFAVKEGRGNATLNLHPQEALEGIYEAMKCALENPAPLFSCPDKIVARITFGSHSQALRASYYPGIEQISPHEIIYTGSIVEIMKAQLFIV
ncbi:MAG: M55 family metallopeptidase [Tissierellia bacterium]|nr:M55 family metallopeptidase [Tissierellia bacterium]